MADKFKIKKGDQVIVITGRDKGKKGEVLEVLRSESRIRVQGINIVKRHRRPTQKCAHTVSGRWFRNAKTPS